MDLLAHLKNQMTAKELEQLEAAKATPVKITRSDEIHSALDYLTKKATTNTGEQDYDLLSSAEQEMLDNLYSELEAIQEAEMFAEYGDEAY